MNLLDELVAITVKLDAEKIPYALCGGLAMAVYALPRATLDIDLMIELDSLTRVRRAMREIGYSLAAEPMEFQQGKVQIYRLCKIDPDSAEEFVLDLLIVTPETMSAWKSRQEIEWKEGRLVVVSPEGLIVLKSLRKSGQDNDDIEYLRSIVDENKD